MRSTDGPGLFLGVDGGGTNTDFVLIDVAGAEIARCRKSTSYHIQIGAEGLRDVLSDGVATILSRSGLSANDITYAFFGLPAYGEDSRWTPLLDALPGEILGHNRYASGNDMICGWSGSLAGKDGICIVAGTGSIGYGENGSRRARSGGWGELFGDEGSAYWIAIRGLTLFSRMADGRQTPGPLLDIFRAAFSLTDDLDLSGIVTEDYQGKRDAIAGLCRLVADAAHQGDDAAREILAAAAGELAEIIHAVRQAIGHAADDVVAVSTAGGVFEIGDGILTPLRAALDWRGRYALLKPIHDSGIGAALYASRLAAQLQK